MTSPERSRDNEAPMREAHKRAVDLEQCSLFVDSAPIARAMTDAAAFLRSLEAARNRRPPVEVQSVTVDCDGIAGGWWVRIVNADGSGVQHRLTAPIEVTEDAIERAGASLEADGHIVSRIEVRRALAAALSEGGEAMTDDAEPARVVRVRIAVVVDSDGDWQAYGRDHTSFGYRVSGAANGMKHGSSVTWVEADIPLPNQPTIKGNITP